MISASRKFEALIYLISPTEEYWLPSLNISKREIVIVHELLPSQPHPYRATSYQKSAASQIKHASIYVTPNYEAVQGEE